MIVNRAERHYIKKAHKNFKVIDDLCFQSKNVYNYANYLIRQKFVETGEIIKRFDMQVIMKDIPDKSVDMIFTDLPYGITHCKWDSIIPLD